MNELWFHSQGEKYFVRVSAYNMKGFGPTQASSPPSAAPSSWHDVQNSAPRYEGCTDKIHMVAAQFGLTLQTVPIIPSCEWIIYNMHTSIKGISLFEYKENTNVSAQKSYSDVCFYCRLANSVSVPQGKSKSTKKANALTRIFTSAVKFYKFLKP